MLSKMDRIPGAKSSPKDKLGNLNSSTLPSCQAVMHSSAEAIIVSIQARVHGTVQWGKRSREPLGVYRFCGITLL